MGERLGYVVVTYNRYGGKPFVGFMHDTLYSAMESRDESARFSKAASQERHVIAEVIELGEDKSHG